MYGQGNYVPRFGQGTQSPRPPFQQLPVNPNFPQGPPNITPPFQYQHPPPMRGQHGPPVRLPVNGVPNASQSFHLPPRPPQAHFSAQQNTQWAQNTQRVPFPPSPPLAPPPPGPYRPEMFQPSVLYRGSIYTPHPSNAHPPHPMGLAPPPLPPSLPPPIPPSPPPPHVSKPCSTFIIPVSEMLESGTGDKVAATTENMDGTNRCYDDKHLTGRTSAEVGSPSLENLSSEERADVDLSSPYAKHRRSSLVVELPEVGSSVQTDLVVADVSPSVSDMEMEDDFTQPDDIHSETVFISEGHVNQEQSCGLQNVVDSNPPQDTVPTFSQLAEEEKGRGSRLSLQNDQPKHESAFPVVDNLIASPTRAAKLEDRFIGVSSSSPSEDTNSTAKPAGELIKTASPFRLISNYSSDDSSDHNEKSSLGHLVPMQMPPSNTMCDASLCGDLQSNLLTDRGLAYERSSSGTINDEVSVVSREDFRGKDVLEVAHEVALEKEKPRNRIKDIQHTPSLKKVDEFGRLVRDVSSDSDPDDSRRTRKHGRSRRSRSRSPHDRRSRRSPRRRERRSWSRSWSPKRRKSRSRSRSPSHRRGIESGGERGRKDKGRLPDCLDFLRGRCHRGASCRYMHQETDKSTSARYNRSMRTSDLGKELEKTPSKKSVHENETLNREKLFPAQGFVQTIVSDQSDKIPVADVGQFKKTNETTLMVMESSDIKEEIFESSHKLPDTGHRWEKEESEHANDCSSSRLINDGNFVSSLVDNSHGIASSTDDLAVEKSLAKNQIEISEPDLNKNASTVSNQGAHFEQPAPPPLVSHGTSVPSPIQPPLNYPYQGHFQMQQPRYPTPPNIRPLPPPPSLQPQFAKNFSAPTPMQGIPPSIQQNQFPPMMFQLHSYPELPPQSEDIRSKPLSMDNNASQTLGTHLSRFPLPSPGLPTTSNTQSFPGMNLPSNEFSAPSSQSHTYSLQQQQYNNGNMNAPFGGSKIALHYNPYASTFDQPFDTKFNSNVPDQGKDLPYANQYGTSHSFSQTPVNSQPQICPQKTAELLKSGNDQYDPLFDSIEPSSNSFKKLDESQGFESTLRLSSSRKELNVGENSKQKEVEIAAISVSVKSNEEFGETADAEVGEVESGKSSNPLDESHVVMGDVEIDELKSPGKGKKSKDSKSMKLFKSSLAEYVKEVLKPHWRQGGMSKEAFKIIVKKTIDKVSGAMKSHHIPKSQEKISRYIDSSERKLNKLVMGYVDKYAKI